MFGNFSKVQFNYNNLDDLDFSNGNRFFITVIKDDMPFEFLLNIKPDSKKLIVMGSGAYNAEKMSPPIFQRYTWHDDFECSSIYYNDPTLYLGKMNLGWGYGTKDEHYIETIGAILRVMIDKLHIKNENLLFYGSSGGGFTSLMLATFMKGSKALVNNPQTIITNYFKKHVLALYKTVYPDSKEDYNNIFINHRINVTEYFKKNSYIPNIYYAQNLSCKDDVDNHLIPFIKETSKLDENIFNKITMYYYSNVSEGHNPLDKESTLKMIQSLLKN